MRKLRAGTDKSKGSIVSVGLGIAAAAIISLIFVIVMASLIEKGKLHTNGKFGIFVIRSVSVLVGGLLGTGLSKKRILPVIGAVTAGYFIVLLAIGLLVLDGGFNNVVSGLFSVLIGGAAACIIKLKPQKARRKTVRTTK